MGNKTVPAVFKQSVQQWNLWETPTWGPPIDSTLDYDTSFTRVGSDDPHWRSKVEQGLNATGTLNVTFSSITYIAGALTFKNPRSSQVVVDTAAGYNVLELASTTFSTAQLADARNTAAIYIRKRIRDEQESYQGLTVLAELRETIQMLRSPSKELYDSLMELLNAHKPKGRRKVSHSKALADSWLVWSFGAQPLISDITAICEAARKFETEKRVKRLTATGKSEAESYSQVANGVYSTAIMARHTRRYHSKSQCRYLVGYEIKPTSQGSSSLDRIIEYGGFNLSSIVPAVWEGIPWSFLIDYFTNIGDVLSAACTSMEGVKWSLEGTRQDNEVSFSDGHFTGDFYRSTYYCTKQVPMQYTSTRTRITRVAVDIPIPGFRLELPGRPAQFLNMAALARMRFN